MGCISVFLTRSVFPSNNRAWSLFVSICVGNFWEGVTGTVTIRSCHHFRTFGWPAITWEIFQRPLEVWQCHGKFLQVMWHCIVDSDSEIVSQYIESTNNKVRKIVVEVYGILWNFGMDMDIDKCNTKYIQIQNMQPMMLVDVWPGLSKLQQRGHWESRMVMIDVTSEGW